MPENHEAGRTDGLMRAALDRLHRGDPAAKNDMLALAKGRLEFMARRMLRTGVSFEAVRRWEQTDDVVQQSLLRLWRTLDNEPINTVSHFFRLASKNIRWELQTIRDACVAKFGLHSQLRTDPTMQTDGGSPAGGRLDSAPARLDPFVTISQYLDVVQVLPVDDQELLDRIFIFGFTRQEAADSLGISLATFKRRYRDASQRLAQRLEPS